MKVKVGRGTSAGLKLVVDQALNSDHAEDVHVSNRGSGLTAENKSVIYFEASAFNAT